MNICKICDKEDIINSKFNSLECCIPCLHCDMEETSITIKNVEILNLFDNSKKGRTIGENDNIDIDSVNNINFNF